MVSYSLESAPAIATETSAATTAAGVATGWPDQTVTKGSPCVSVYFGNISYCVKEDLVFISNHILFSFFWPQPCFLPPNAVIFFAAVRRNIMQMSAAEQQAFVNALDQAKKTTPWHSYLHSMVHIASRLYTQEHVNTAVGTRDTNYRSNFKVRLGFYPDSFFGALKVLNWQIFFFFSKSAFCRSRVCYLKAVSYPWVNNAVF